MWRVGGFTTREEGTHTHTHAHPCCDTLCRSPHVCAWALAVHFSAGVLFFAAVTLNMQTSHPLLECRSGYNHTNNFSNLLIRIFEGYTREAGPGFKAVPGGLWVWPLTLGVVEARQCVSTSTTSEERKWEQSWAAECILVSHSFVWILVFPYWCHHKKGQMKKIQQGDDMWSCDLSSVLD